MMVNTHKILAINFIESIDNKKLILIKENHFIWGTLKPDCASKYKFKKHYLNESLPMIVKKIQFLSSLNLSYIYKHYSLNRFNQELGVICHFLCDYFCVPHHQRWEFKSPSAVKDHILYEKDLNKFSKDFKIKTNLQLNLSNMDIQNFILSLQNEYEQSISFQNDLIFSQFICSSVINFIFEEVMTNESLCTFVTNVV